MYKLYNFLLLVFSLGAFPIFLAKFVFTPQKRRVYAQKLGFFPRETLEKMEGEPRIWIHAVSLGEVGAIHPLVRELRKVYPGACLMVSTGTESGQKMARERLTEASGTFYFPWDCPRAVRKAIRRLRPELFAISETELWPNFLRIAKEEGAKNVLVNGRISDRSFRRYRKVRFFFTAVLDNLDALSMIRVQDGERIITMGANPVHVSVNGNCKFDQAASQAIPVHREEMREIAGLRPQDRVLVAGSTHEGEEEAVLNAFLRLVQTDPEALLILAPRHIDRADRVVKLLEGHGIQRWVRRSRLPGEGGKRARVILWDTFGELSKVYSLATLVFCGGSLVSKRGQNILEPAAWGKVVLYGPSMEDFRDAHEFLSGVGAGIMIRNGEELAERCLYFWNHPRELKERGEAGKEALLAQRGATQRNLELIRKLLGR
ncbi:MAG: 3-deoxy-D-manno-octulosonic acid transferase [Syntrophaceae bacterium]|nr:3-deoxy-D-manno-octulosonic acid transferase [Syntrophaceae bacterium]